MHPTDYLVHFSNVLMLVAYSVTDILAAMVRGRRRSHQHPLLPLAADQALAARGVGARLHDH
jgi:hypothetical protein